MLARALTAQAGSSHLATTNHAVAAVLRRGGAQQALPYVRTPSRAFWGPPAARLFSTRLISPSPGSLQDGLARAAVRSRGRVGVGRENERALMMLNRSMHVRALSFNAVPKAVFRAFRVPAYAFTAAGGAFAYANYKVDGTCSKCGSPIRRDIDCLLTQYRFHACLIRRVPPLYGRRSLTGWRECIGDV